MKKLSLFFALLLLAACTTIQPVDPASAQMQLRMAWQQPWRGVWELSWPQAPLPGSIVFQGWQTEAGGQRRYEILEAPIPAWVGLTYVNNGVTAGYANRLESTAPVVGSAQALSFAPISAAMTTIGNLLSQPPPSAERQPAGDSIIKLTLHYPETQTLALWLNTQTNLVIRVELQTPNTELTLAARSLEPLASPHPALFEIGH